MTSPFRSLYRAQRPTGRHEENTVSQVCNYRAIVCGRYCFSMICGRCLWIIISAPHPHRATYTRRFHQEKPKKDECPLWNPIVKAQEEALRPHPWFVKVIMDALLSNYRHRT